MTELYQSGRLKKTKILLRGQDSDLLRKLMGLPGKPFPTLPRYEIAPRSAAQPAPALYEFFAVIVKKID
jgi:hypothetical protein